MSYTWGPNRDSGSVRRHRNPDTKRRYPRSETGMHFKAHNGRAAMNAAMHAAMPLLRTGCFDACISPVRRGWDNGDPLSRSVLIVETADYIALDGRPVIDDGFEYPETPEWVWDELYAASLGIEWYEDL